MTTNINKNDDNLQRGSGEAVADELTSKPTRKRSAVWRWAKRVILFVVLGYVGIILFLMANETNLVYPGSKYPRGNWQPTDFEFEEMEFTSSDGTKLYGWFLPVDEPKSGSDVAEDQGVEKRDVVLLCHGNGENIAQSAVNNGIYFRHYLNADVFVFDYRGFGKSEGTPDEPGVLADSEAALTLLCDKTGCSCSEVILVGHSIGGGPAIHLASKYGCKMLILQRTFSKLTAPAQNMYPWIPVSYIMRNQYPSIEKIKSYDGPVFQSHGDSDKLIPINFAKELFETIPSERKAFFEVEGMTHWDPLPVNYWTEMSEFVRLATED